MIYVWPLQVRDDGTVASFAPRELTGFCSYLAESIRSSGHRERRRAVFANLAGIYEQSSRTGLIIFRQLATRMSP